MYLLKSSNSWNGTVHDMVLVCWFFFIMRSSLFLWVMVGCNLIDDADFWLNFPFYLCSASAWNILLYVHSYTQTRIERSVYEV